MEGGPRIGTVQVYQPVLCRLHGKVGLHFDTVGMDFLHVARREEPLGRRQPDDPVVDVGVEPACAAAQFIYPLFADIETHSGVIAEAVFVFKVGVAARQKVEVVQSRKTIVARYGGFHHHVPFARNQSVDEECRDERSPFVARHLLAQDQRQAQRARQAAIWPIQNRRARHAPLSYPTTVLLPS